MKKLASPLGAPEAVRSALAEGHLGVCAISVCKVGACGNFSTDLCTAPNYAVDLENLSIIVHCAFNGKGCGENHFKKVYPVPQIKKIKKLEGIMKVRVTGTMAECQIAKHFYENLKNQGFVEKIEISRFYYNRKDCRYRCYIDIDYKKNCVKNIEKSMIFKTGI